VGGEPTTKGYRAQRDGRPLRSKPDRDASETVQARRSERRLSKLPPLGLFRTFDAAARHRSFRLAADELCVTPSAVSQQIRNLEDFLNIRLFRRLPRRIELTREGTILADVVQETLVTLIRTCSRLSDPATPSLICVNTSPSIASRWLVPRLKRFMESNSQIKITLLASSDPVDFDRQDVDVAIRWGSEQQWQAEFRAELLVQDSHFPVCSPSLLSREKIVHPSDLSRMTALNEVNGAPWARWFSAAGCAPVNFQDSLYFSDASLMLEAAAQGQGICLTNFLIVESDILSGRLVRPFSASVKLKKEGYYVLTNPAYENKPIIKMLLSWLHEEAELSMKNSTVKRSKILSLIDFEE
jgi:LysR family glycine cleavage system transcriptional activator